MSISNARQIITAKNPSLAEDSRLEDYILLAKMSLSAKPFGLKYEYAVALLVLHQITIESQTSTGFSSVGAVTSKREGQLSVNFSGVASNTPWRKQYFMSSPYGQELQFLISSTIFSPRNRFV